MKIWKFYLLSPVTLLFTGNILFFLQASAAVTTSFGVIALNNASAPIGMNKFNLGIEYSPDNNLITGETYRPQIAADHNRSYGILPVQLHGDVKEKSAQTPGASGATNTEASMASSPLVKRHSMIVAGSGSPTLTKNEIDQPNTSFRLHITDSKENLSGRIAAVETKLILITNLLFPVNRYAAHQPGNPGNMSDKASNSPAQSTSLPVSIVSIKAALKNAAVQINWEAREELNLNLYEVERSTDGANFQTIGLVFPWENPEASSNYRFTDQHPQSGINFYRLRGVDKDGSFKYSVIVQAGNAQLPANPVSIVPNPVKGSIRAVFSGLAKAAYVVELRTVAGTLQLKKTITIQQADQLEILDPGYAAPGIYWLTIFDQQLQKLGSSRVVIQ